MSTRGRVGIEMPDGKIKSIYVHFDNYLSGTGKTLLKQYTSRDKVEKLIDLGDCSSIGGEFDEELAKRYWENTGQLSKEELAKVSNMTIPYSARGETDVDARIDNDESEFIANAGNSFEEFVYLWKKDFRGIERWHYMEVPFFKTLEAEDVEG